MKIWLRRKLDCLRTDKSPGADNISSRVLIVVKKEIVYPLTQIMHCSLASGIVPEHWKVAQVIPIHKKGIRSH